MCVSSVQVQSQLMIYFFNCVYNLLYLAFVVNKFQIFHCTLNCIYIFLVSFSGALIFLTAKVKAITAKLLGYKKYFSKFQCMTKKKSKMYCYHGLKTSLLRSLVFLLVTIIIVIKLGTL